MHLFAVVLLRLVIQKVQTLVQENFNAEFLRWLLDLEPFSSKILALDSSAILPIFSSLEILTSQPPKLEVARLGLPLTQKTRLFIDHLIHAVVFERVELIANLFFLSAEDFVPLEHIHTDLVLVLQPHVANEVLEELRLDADLLHLGL